MPGPEARYASAAALHDDLERHLRSLPLRHVCEPSLLERAAKWLRRHPRATSATGIVSAATLVVGLMAAGLVVRGNRLAAFEAAAALADFRNDFRAAQIAALAAPGAPGLGWRRLRQLAVKRSITFTSWTTRHGPTQQSFGVSRPSRKTRPARTWASCSSFWPR